MGRGMDRGKVLVALSDEREKQIDMGYTAEHDAGHAQSDWRMWLQHELDCSHPANRKGQTVAAFKRSVTKLGAVCVAILEVPDDCAIVGE